MPRRFDPVGQVLMMVLLGAVTFGVIQGPGQGWTSPVIVAAFGTSAAALAGLLAYEPRRADPLVDLRFFRSIPFSASISLSVRHSPPSGASCSSIPSTSRTSWASRHWRPDWRPSPWRS